MSDVDLLELQLVRDGSSVAAARECEAAVFWNAYGNTREQLDDEYGPYEDDSAFIALAEHGGDVVAVCRVIRPGVAGLKTLNDLSRQPWGVDGRRAARAAGVDPARTVDVATIGVRHGLGRGRALAAVALYHGIVAVTRANNLPFVVMLMDERARRLLTAVGCETQLLPGTRGGPYLGSAITYPLWANVPTMMDRQRAVNPEAHRMISMGRGLDGIQVPALSAFALDGALQRQVRGLSGTLTSASSAAG
jgi:hypothetical protein